MDTATGVDSDGSVRSPEGRCRTRRARTALHCSLSRARARSAAPLSLTPCSAAFLATQKAYASPADLWREVEADLEGGWYGKAVAYWDAQPATDDGVLGGHADAVAAADVEQSEAFLARALGPRRLAAAAAGGKKGEPPLVAADCGAGVGRVSRDLLLRFCAVVDLVEPSAHLLAAARARLGSAVKEAGAGLVGAPRAFLQTGLQAWAPAPASYDVVWVQWALLYLTDADAIAFLARAAGALKPGGVLVVKENVAASGFVVDREDRSLTRSHPYMLDLGRAAGLTCVADARQRGFPAGLFGVRMYAWRKAGGGSA